MSKIRIYKTWCCWPYGWHVSTWGALGFNIQTFRTWDEAMEYAHRLTMEPTA